MSLKGKHIALFVANYYEDLEFWYPYYRMQEEGASLTVIGPERATFTGKYGVPVVADKAIDEVNVKDFDALIIPGGYAPDHMRRSQKMIAFTRDIHHQGGIVATICHGGWMLASAGIVKGRKLTGFFAIQDDLVNAGARWVDEAAVVDERIVTSRTPKDLPQFCRAIIDTLVDSWQVS